MIAPKLYARMTDMQEELALAHEQGHDISIMDSNLVNFQEQIRWPWKASQEQISDWNAKRE